MALFTGTFENKVDKKGRVSLPADFRAELPDGGERTVYVYPSPKDDCLEACDKAFMQRLVDSIEDAPLYSDEEDDLGSTIVAQARKASSTRPGVWSCLPISPTSPVSTTRPRSSAGAPVSRSGRPTASRITPKPRVSA